MDWPTAITYCQQNESGTLPMFNSAIESYAFAAVAYVDCYICFSCLLHCGYESQNSLERITTFLVALQRGSEWLTTLQLDTLRG